MDLPLTSLRTLREIQPLLDQLPHVVRSIEAYLVNDQWTLESASKRGFFRVLGHLLKRERTGFNQKCRQLRLKAGVEATVIHGYDLRVLQWWLKHYIPDQNVISLERMFVLAIRHTRIDILEWLYQENDGDLPRLDDLDHDTIRTDDWEAQAVRAVCMNDQESNDENSSAERVVCSDPNTIIWLYEHGRHHLSVQLEFRPENWQDDQVMAIQQCLLYEDEDSSFVTVNTETVVLQTIKHGKLEHVQWLYQHRRGLFRRSYLGEGVYYGRLQVIKWLYEQFPNYYFDDPELEGSFVPSSLYEIETIRWVLCEFKWKNDRNRLLWITDAAKHCARDGSLDMVKFLYQTRIDQLMSEQDASGGATDISNDLALSPVILQAAAANGHLEIIQWIYSQSSQVIVPTAMDSAAANGHLEIVKWLHQNRSDGCTPDAMNSAAANGHLELVQWLHENRSEGCTTEAMDFAAAESHLNVIEWLHENRSEGCTKNAMNYASNSGDLRVLRWLHTNRNEGFTAAAMMFAAIGGHVDVIRFLHEIRAGGCPDHILYPAAFHNPLDTFKWLYEDRLGSFDFEASELAQLAELGGPHLKCLALYTGHNRLGWFLDQLIETGDFETVELLLSRARADGLTRVGSKYVDVV